MTKSLALCGAAVLSLVGVVNAQIAKEQFRVQFDISKNGTAVAKPVLILEAGNAGTIRLSDGLTFKLEPFQIDANTVRITCQLENENAKPQLHLYLRGENSASLSLTLGGDSFGMSATLAR